MRKRSPFIGALGALSAVAVLGTAVPASSGTAEAALVLCPIPIGVFPAPDNIRLTTVGFDFGEGELDSNNEPTSCGKVTWDLANDTIEPRLTGKMFAKNGIGTEIRMQMRHFDVDGTHLQTTRGQTKEVLSNDVEEFPISLGTYENPLTYKVSVDLQLKVAGVWQTQATQSAYIASSAKAPDSVLVTSPGKDFGTGVLNNGVPSGSGTLTWDLANDTTEPTLTGNLYLLNSAGTKVRMRMRYYDIHGNQLGNGLAGSTHEPLTNSLHTIPINLSGYDNPEIYKVEVNVTVLVGGAWTAVGNTVTVTI